MTFFWKGGLNEIFEVYFAGFVSNFHFQQHVVACVVVIVIVVNLIHIFNTSIALSELTGN